MPASARSAGSYKWTALSNTTLGTFMATVDSSIVIISMPAIFRGIALNPLEPANIGYLLWMLMGYMVCMAVLVVAFGRLGDMFGRVKMYNAGFLIFTLASIALSLTPWQGGAAALYMILMRIVQGIGSAFLLANSAAILTDAFPVEERGFAMGINMIAAIAGQFIGLLAGGVLADIHWRLVFWVSVPVGLFGTVWAYWKLHETGTHDPQEHDWLGNVTFAAGLILILVGITYGIQPSGHHLMGWTSPDVVAELSIGLLLLVAFVFIERRVAWPMVDLDLFKIRAFTAGNVAGLLSALGRGGLQFMLIIWLQGIWLPLHGFAFERTPLWAGIYMLPLTVGFLVAGPLSGWLSDRHGARYYATGGMLVGAVGFWSLMRLPANFGFVTFALLLCVMGIGTGLFAAPNTTAIMNAVPANERGQASGIRTTFINAGQVLSIGVFFSLMIIGLAGTLPSTMSASLIREGVPAPVARQAASEPPVASLFAAFLGYNPMQQLLPKSVLASLPPQQAAAITGKEFFPRLISRPFMHGLQIAFTFSLLAYLIAAAASWMGGGRLGREEAGHRDMCHIVEL